MKGLEKLGGSHLTPQALVAHGKRLLEALLEASGRSDNVRTSSPAEPAKYAIASVRAVAAATVPTKRSKKSQS